MEIIDNDHHQGHGSTSAAPNQGVTNFLRHFSHRNQNKDGASSSSSQLKKSSRLLRHLGRNSNNHHHHKNHGKYSEDSIISPVSDPGSAATTAFRSRSKGKHYLTHRADDEQDMITFDSDATRLGIRPTCYDVVPAGKHANHGVYNGNHIDIEEEVYFLNNNVAAASSVTPLSSASVPNLFSSFPIWEETRPDDLYDSTHGGSSGSPQKSVASCDSIQSDGKMADEEDCHFIMPSSSSSPSKERGPANRNRSNIHCSVSSKLSTNLMQKAKSIVQRSRDKDNHSCDGSQISSSSSVRSLSKASRKSSNGSITGTHVDTVKIFLLLVEPKSKVFELIQLLYPRYKTKVIDLLKMIPKNATEQALATQSYVGITRPKRRADPITDLLILASNSVFNVAGNPTAAIESGEIIVAIPALTSTKDIVVLSKQILASAHIQKLISISKGGPVMDVSGVVKKRKSDATRKSGSKKSPTHSIFSPIRQDDTMTNESRSPKIVSFVDQNCTEELKRAVDNANLANEEAGCSPSITPTSFLSESINTTDPINEAKTVEFPRDMLDAYMSKDAVLKMCATPDHKIPNIECMSSSSVVEEEEEDTDVDVSSCDGSMTSSFHSWALSLDSTSLPSMHRGTLNAGASMSQVHGRKKKHFITRKMKRVAMVFFVASIARYHLDPNGIDSAQNLRGLKWFEPMGFMGLFYFGLFIGMLIKLQMYYRYSSPTGTTTRCPVIRSVSKLYRRFQRGVAAKPDDEPSFVPSSIHAIKFG